MAQQTGQGMITEIPLARRHDRGFTLVELVMALTLLAILSSTLYGVFAFAGKTQFMTARSSASTDQIVSTQRFLRAQLGQAISQLRLVPGKTTANAADSVERGEFYGTRTTLGFTAPWLTHIGQGRLFHFRLGVESNNLVVRWKSANFAGNLDEARDAEIVGSRILLTKVASMSIGYFGSNGTEAGFQWYPNWQTSAFLPSMLRINVELGENKSGQWPELIILMAA